MVDAWMAMVDAWVAMVERWVAISFFNFSISSFIILIPSLSSDSSRCALIKGNPISAWAVGRAEGVWGVRGGVMRDGGVKIETNLREHRSDEILRGFRQSVQMAELCRQQTSLGWFFQARQNDSEDTEGEDVSREGVTGGGVGKTQGSGEGLEKMMRML